MFVARERELADLESCYRQPTFQMVVLYGRRRVGKTALLEEFARGKRALMFTAQQQGERDNLRDFSRGMYAFFNMPTSLPAFESWLDAFEFLAQKAACEKTLIVFDEFPYAAKATPQLPSALQIAIDRWFSKTQSMIVLCGSNQGFMEDEVLGEKSPLYGRRTAQMKLKPFDYYDAARMMPSSSAVDRIVYYASLGGTPYYLSALRSSESYVQNVARLFFDRTGLMFDEPGMLMRQELREPSMYHSVLRALAHGANRSNEIADRTGIPSSSITMYLKTLADLDVIERLVPFGEPEKSKRSLYRIKDPAFAFWFHFVAPFVPAIESGLGEQAAVRLLEGPQLSEYVGRLFERACLEWLVRESRAGRLPIEPTRFGSWWGTDPRTRAQDDIDVIAADDIDKRAIIGECKWRTSFDESATLEKLEGRTALVPGYREYWRFLFTKAPVSEATRSKGAIEPHVRFVTADDLFA